MAFFYAVIGWYDADLGRWLAPDPMGQHFSPYLAMSNNPVSYIDPSGGEDRYDISIDLDNIGLSVKYSNYYDYYEDLIFTSWAGDAKGDVQHMKRVEEANAARSFEKSLGQAGLYMLSPITVSAKDGVSWSDRRRLQSEISFIQDNLNGLTPETWVSLYNKTEEYSTNEWLHTTAYVFSAAGIGGTVKTEMFEYAVRNSYKTARTRSEFRKLQPAQQAWRTTNTLGKTGVRYLKYSKALGVAGNVVGVTSAGVKLIQNPTTGNATRLAVQGVAIGATFIPVVGWGVSLGIGAADLIWGDDFYEWIDKP